MNVDRYSILSHDRYSFFSHDRGGRHECRPLHDIRKTAAVDMNVDRYMTFG